MEPFLKDEHKNPEREFNCFVQFSNILYVRNWKYL